LTGAGQDFKIKGTGEAHIVSEGIDMRMLSQPRLVVLTGLALSLLAGAGRVLAADDKDKGNSLRVQLPTCDGIELSGTFYPNAGGKKDAVVILLHNIDPRKGGGSHQDGWDTLAAKLQAQGYAVLSFDFRGFGSSKSVTAAFWKFGHNQAIRGARAKADTIDQKDFPPGYYLALVNDIAAARAYLDRKNDARELNTSNLILIGAGEGATLGALWMAAEMRRQRDLTPNDLGLGEPLIPKLDDAEGKDLAAGIWLSISPTLAGRNVSSVLRADLEDVAREGKVPTIFLYGKNDTKSGDLTLNYLNAIQKGKRGEKIELRNTGEKAIAGTELSGSKLLSDRLGTIPFIITRLNSIMEDRGSKEWKKREEEKSRYFWSLPSVALPRTRLTAKVAGEKLAAPIPPAVLGFPR
jgi:pimeloyl-ACP methyl ester carboxylesterase